ncbi:MAG: Sir2 family NAD-dependent protein deacetylase [Anaerolineales bacterium]|nr:Sir2 family NAD-dependent protein deacetylase [Anaerolineales bacterium]HJO33184.1 Sir2 family NAD-dependent protein deacetylase [Anaerolineales bacterium]
MSRSRGTGLWEHVDPMEMASLAGFRRKPEAFYGWTRPLAQRMFVTELNHGHHALAALEHGGFLASLITQNIDQMHRRAGSQRMFELHGEIGAACCLSCGRSYASDQFREQLLRAGTGLPTCAQCRSVLKPEVILFGEILPEKTMRQAQQAALSCDLMLVAGSSLQVFQAADLPAMAHRNGAALIIINREETHLDQAANVVLHADVSETLPAIAARLPVVRAVHTRETKVT